MGKYMFELIFDNGKILYISAKTRAEAIEDYCTTVGVCKEWVKQHCRIVKLGMVIQ